MDLLSSILSMANNIASIVAALVIISSTRKGDKIPSQNETPANMSRNNENTRFALIRKRRFRNLASLCALLVGLGDLVFVMYGPPRDLPLTGESGALLAYGLVFIFLGFYLRR